MTRTRKKFGGDPKKSEHLPPVTAGRAPGWYPDVRDPYVIFQWDGAAWIAERRRVGSEWVETRFTDDPAMAGGVAVSPDAVPPQDHLVTVQAPTAAATSTAGPPAETSEGASSAMAAPIHHRSRRTTWTILAATLAACLVAGAVVVVVGSNSATPSHRGQLSDAEMHTVVAATWPTLVRDLHSKPRDLHEVTTDKFLPAVLNAALCGCLVIPPLPGNFSVSASLSRHPPLSFLAEYDISSSLVATSSGIGRTTPFQLYVVFEQQAFAKPWKVSSIVSDVDPQRLLAPPSLAPTTRISLQRQRSKLLNAFAQLVSAFFFARNRGYVPAANPWNHLLPHSEHSAVATTLATLKLDHASDVRAHRTQAGPYYAASRTAVFPTPNGLVQCEVIAGYGRYARGPIVQPRDRSAFGNTLAPGTYSSVTVTSARDVCMLVKPNGQLSIVGGFEGGSGYVFGTRLRTRGA